MNYPYVNMSYQTAMNTQYGTIAFSSGLGGVSALASSENRAHLIELHVLQE